MLNNFSLSILLQLLTLNHSASQTNSELMEKEKSLHYVIKDAKDKAKQSPLLVLLHGYGSNENDLLSLSENIPNNWMVVSVRGPYKVTENSYRWYDVKMTNGKIVINFDEEEKSRKKLMDLLFEIKKGYNIDSQKVTVAGFSQGANMAQFLGLGVPSLVTSFGVFSGRFVEEFMPYISNSTSLKNSKVFISHGSEDKMLPKIFADENRAKLNELGIKITYCEDTNGHSISEKQWSEFCKWLQFIN
jgi:phospholipase/carboxylesterase